MKPWERNRPRTAFTPSSLGAAGVCGGLTQDAGALWPVQWQWLQALSLHQPHVLCGDIRAGASFYPWQRGSWSGCEQALSKCSAASVQVPLPSF